MKFRFSASYVRQKAENHNYLFRMRNGNKLGLFSHFRTYARFSAFSRTYRRLAAVNPSARLEYTRREKVHHATVARRLHPVSGIVPHDAGTICRRLLCYSDRVYFTNRRFYCAAGFYSVKPESPYFSAKYARLRRYIVRENRRVMKPRRVRVGVECIHPEKPCSRYEVIYTARRAYAHYLKSRAALMSRRFKPRHPL